MDNVVTAAEERIYAEGLSWESIEFDNDPIEVMFDCVDLRLDGDCSLVDFDYDDDFGFVRSCELSCEGLDAGRVVKCFLPDASDITACDATP